MNYNSRYKEKDPYNTLKVIKEIFIKLKLDIEEFWFNKNDNLYSLRINIQGTSIGANGKGSKEIFALASAYGELIERLQNLLYFRLSDYNFIFTEKENYRFFNDEIKIKEIFYDNSNKKFLLKILNTIDSQKIKQISNFMKNKNGFINNIKFKNLNDNHEDIIIPTKMVDVLYGSNGMASGNTFEEAFVQGISEIIERFVNKEVLKKSLSGTDITNYIINKNDHIREIINKIEGKNYRLIIKNMNLNKGFPVVAVILIKNDSLDYLVNFGCHPSLEISTERAITELFQGIKIDNIFELKSMNENFDIAYSKKNIMKIFENGNGIYPASIFLNKPIKNNNIFWNKKFNNNKEMMELLIKYIEKMGYEIYYKDVSYLGFPSYHFIIPGMSELTENLYEDILKLKKWNLFKEIYMNINKITKLKAKFLIKCLEDEEISSDFSLDQLYNLPKVLKKNLKNISKEIMLIVLYTYIGDNKNAYKISNNYLNSIKNEESDIIIYYKTVSTILNLKKSNFDEEDIKRILSNFLNDNFIYEVLNDLDNKNIFRYLPIITPSKIKNSNIILKEIELFKILFTYQKNN